MFTLKIVGEGCQVTSWYADLSSVSVHGYFEVKSGTDIFDEMAKHYPDVINDTDATVFTDFRDTVKHACVATAWDATQSRRVAYVFPNGHGFLLDSSGDTIDRVS